MHLCGCGCGNEVGLRLSPTDWRLTDEGQSISVRPSIGSWSRPCRSHYFIDGGRVVWAGDWTDAEIAHGRALDRSRRATRDRQPYPPAVAGPAGEHGPLSAGSARAAAPAGPVAAPWPWLCRGRTIGRAACRERGCKYG